MRKTACLHRPPDRRGGRKVLGRVEQAKAQHDYIASETRRMVTSLVADPVAAVAEAKICNFLTDVGARDPGGRRPPEPKS